MEGRGVPPSYEPGIATGTSRLLLLTHRLMSVGRRSTLFRRRTGGILCALVLFICASLPISPVFCSVSIMPYINNEYGFSIHAPAGWRIDDTSEYVKKIPYAVVAFYGPKIPETGGIVNIIIGVDPNPSSGQALSLNEYFFKNKLNVETMYPSVLSIAEETRIVNGLTCCDWLAEITYLGFQITGIKVEIERSAGNKYSHIKDVEAKIVKSDGSLGTENKADLVTEWPQADAYRTYGGDGDLWSETWSSSDINDPDFGVVISAKLSQDGSADGVARIDHVRITIYYSVAVGGMIVPLNTLSVLAPYLAMIGLVAVATTAAIALRKHRN